MKTQIFIQNTAIREPKVQHFPMAKYLTYVWTLVSFYRAQWRQGGKGAVFSASNKCIGQGSRCMLQPYCQSFDWAQHYCKSENDCVSKLIRMPKWLNAKMEVGRHLQLILSWAQLFPWLANFYSVNFVKNKYIYATLNERYFWNTGIFVSYKITTTVGGCRGCELRLEGRLIKDWDCKPRQIIILQLKLLPTQCMKFNYILPQY